MKLFGGRRQVLKYLARYTHRVAIANHRLLELKDGRVDFQLQGLCRGESDKDNDAVCEFTRRFLLHILPRGFVKIRHYAFRGIPGNRKSWNSAPGCNSSSRSNLSL